MCKVSTCGNSPRVTEYAPEALGARSCEARTAGKLLRRSLVPDGELLVAGNPKTRHPVVPLLVLEVIPIGIASPITDSRVLGFSEFSEKHSVFPESETLQVRGLLPEHWLGIPTTLTKATNFEVRSYPGYAYPGTRVPGYPG
eukprot:497884-Rhodomonas_salina.1